jgi:hypothetical protein
MLKDDDFSNVAKVDRYGRKLNVEAKKKALERLYRPEDEDKEESGSEGDVEVEDDDVVEKELAKAENYDPARGGGFDESSSEEESDEEEEDVDVEDEETFPNLQEEATAVPMGEVTKRIAVVNLDWDNIRATDLFAVFQSFCSGGGRIEHLAVYKSEFGKERMEREEMEGPPREIFNKSNSSSSKSKNNDDFEDFSSEEDESAEDDEKIRQDLLKPDEGEEFDSAALRQYQLERLRYYYAIVTFSDERTAQAVYEATDGTEYLTSANFFDLRFVPEDTEFDDKPRDECREVPEGYRPNEFVTDALQHSKVKLTWDAEDKSRKEVINKAFSGSRADIADNDLRAYIGSDSSDDEEEEDAAEEEELDMPKLTKKELARQKMRAALGLPDEPIKASKTEKAPVGDMEITFTPGLSASDKKGVFVNEPIIEETTAEAYIRKEKERKQRRKERSKAKREGIDPAAAAAAESGDEEAEAGDADLGFNDPFFAEDPEVKHAAEKAARKAAKEAKYALKKKAQDEADAQRAELELLMTDGVDEAGRKIEHFDINEIARAEKLAKRRGAKGKKGKDARAADEDRKGALQKGFEMPVDDPRFSKVFESHEYAIDTSNPKFKATEGMKKLLEEGRKKRKGGVDEEEEVSRPVKRRSEKGGESEELKKLVESVKRKVKR